MENIERDARIPNKVFGRKSEIEERETENPAMRAFERYSKRVLPRFAAMSDKIQMGFEHYSPWAVARRSKVSYSVNKKPARRGVYNMTAFEGILMFKLLISKQRLN